MYLVKHEVVERCKVPDQNEWSQCWLARGANRIDSRDSGNATKYPESSVEVSGVVTADIPRFTGSDGGPSPLCA